MSEHYIQSQFLIKQITDDFFKEKSSNIRIKNQDYEMKDDDVESLISDISDESDLVKMDSPVLNDQYHYLENNNDLHKLFDFCDYNEDVLQELKIYLCCYTVNNDTILPFLQFLLIENNGNFTFPSFPFKCATNIPENEDGEITSKDVFFRNECIKCILKYIQPLEELEQNPFEDVFQGYVKSEKDENTLYVVMDISKFHVEENILAIVDEIVNQHKVLDKDVTPETFQLFYENSDLMQIKNKWNKAIEIPLLLYRCSYDEKYKNIENEDKDLISIIDDRIEHPLLGNSYIFSSNPIDETVLHQLKRYCVFVKKPIYIMKNLKDLELQEDPFTLGKVIPSIVEFTQSNSKKEDDAEEQDDTEEQDDAEEQEDDAEEQEDDAEEQEDDAEEQEDAEEEDDNKLPTNAELIEEIMDLSINDHNSVYFHETQDEKDIIFWSIKSSNHFTEL